MIINRLYTNLYQLAQVLKPKCSTLADGIWKYLFRFSKALEPIIEDLVEKKIINLDFKINILQPLLSSLEPEKIVEIGGFFPAFIRKISEGDIAIEAVDGRGQAAT